MPIIEDGPVIEETISWEAITARFRDFVALHEDETNSEGVSIQKAGGGGNEALAMRDQLRGKLGPSIGKWDPEAASRMIQEF